MDCVFCHKEKLVTDIVYEDELVMAFMDMEPINEGHILLVPKEHYLDVDEIPNETLSHLMIISKKIVSVLKETSFTYLSLNAFFFLSTYFLTEILNLSLNTEYNLCLLIKKFAQISVTVKLSPKFSFINFFTFSASSVSFSDIASESQNCKMHEPKTLQVASI